MYFSGEKVLWECANGHQWSALPSNVVKGHWCMKCSVANRKLKLRSTNSKPQSGFSIKDFQTIAISRGGVCLSKVYENSKTRMSWRCAIGHTWTTNASNIKSGHWCPKCSVERNSKARSGSLVEQHQLAALRGGEFLEIEYLGSQIPQRWRCSKGHEWAATPASVKSGTWCRQCGFVKTANALRLTLCDAQLLAIERGGLCLATSYTKSSEKIKWQCDMGHSWLAPMASVQQGHWCPKCGGSEKLTIEKMRSLAKERQGECISTHYANSRSKLTWRCQVGHVWEATPDSIVAGKWCHVCGGSKKLTLLDMQALAKSRGGECLSSIYANVNTKLLWICGAKHQWEATPDKIRRGTWCPVCARKRKKFTTPKIGPGKQRS